MNYGIYIMFYNQARGVTMVGPIAGDPVKFADANPSVNGYQVVEIMTEADWAALKWDASKDAELSSKAEYIGQVKEAAPGPAKG